MTRAPGLVLVVEDDGEMRASIEFLLATERRGTRSYPTAEALLSAPLPGEASCVLADVRLGGGLDGVALAEALAQRQEALPVVIMTGHADLPLAVRAMRAGAVDFLEKPFETLRLLEAIAGAERRQARHAPQHSPAARHRLGSLSPRERQVLEELVTGQPNKVVAQSLGLSIRTVESYRAAIMMKLEARSFAEMLRVALAAGVG